jgi:hypothetical protein
MMKAPLLSALMLMGAAPLPAPAGTFTATDGRSLEGEIREANEKTVTIRRSGDNRDVVVPLERLVPADQQAIAKWRQGRALSKITVTASKDKVFSDTQSRGTYASATDTKDQMWNWVITVKNGSAYPVSGLTLDWGQVVERTDRNQAAASGPAKTVVRRSEGTVPVPDIPAFGSVKVKTQPIPVQSMKSVSSTFSTNSSGDTTQTITSYKWDEALSGLGVQVMAGTFPVTQWKTGTDPGTSPQGPIPGMPPRMPPGMVPGGR